MSEWYVLDIGSIKVDPVAQRLIDVQAEFMKSFLVVPAGSGRALFWRENATTGRTEMFFTPQAQDIALQFGAIARTKPSIRNGHIKALVGDQDLDVSFPGQEQQ